MTTVNQMLKQKGKTVWTVTPDTSVHEALITMAEKKIGAVLVIEGDHIIGILSERDVARELSKSETFSLKTPVQKIMTKAVFYISPDVTVEECMALMSEKHIRHLPVVEGGKLVGIISIGDVVKATIAAKDITIRSLENYIMGIGYNK